MKTKVFVYLVCFIVSTSSYAGGSFSLDRELMPLLSQKPVLKQFVLDAFDFHWTGGANRIGTTVNSRLGGMRIGPYYLKAKPKGAEGNYTLTVIFHTEIKFKDKNGMETTLPEAYAVEEVFHSFEIVPINSDSAIWLEKKF